MAAGYKDFTAGAVLAAADLEDYCQNQSVMRFATTAARDTALSSVKTEGMLAASLADDRLYVYTGSTWQYLGHYSSAGRPGVVLTGAAQTITTSTATDLTWNAESFDVDGWIAVPGTTLTVPTGWGGQYHICCNGSWSASAGTSQHVVIDVNGSARADGMVDGTFSRPTANLLITLAAGDTIKCRVFHNAGANRDFTPRLEIAWLGA